MRGAKKQEQPDPTYPPTVAKKRKERSMVLLPKEKGEHTSMRAAVCCFASSFPVITGSVPSTNRTLFQIPFDARSSKTKASFRLYRGDDGRHARFFRKVKEGEGRPDLSSRRATFIAGALHLAAASSSRSSSIASTASDPSPNRNS